MTLNLATILREGALRHPDRIALVLGSRKANYGSVDAEARRLAGALAASGVRRGDTVALMLPNVPEFPIAYFAAHYIGAIVVPLNVLLTADEVEYHLCDSKAVALVAWEGFVDAAVAGFARVDTCRFLIVARSGQSTAMLPAPALDLQRLVADALPVAETAPTNPEDTAVILYTSGTTGRPKGAELTHFNLFYNAEYCRTTLLPLRSEEAVALATLPLFHSFGQTVVQNRFLMSGGTVVLLPRFEPLAVLRTIAEHRVSFFAGVPTMYVALLGVQTSEELDLASLKICVSGGAALPVEVLRAFEQRFGVPVLEGYGLSETSPVACFNVLDRPRKSGSIGVPIGGVEMRLVDDQGRVVEEPGVPGEIFIKGHNVMKGYFGKPEATREALVDGWFATGDVATRDVDGYHFIVDRKKDMIIRGGFNVYPREIEEVLYAHPAVREAAVIGLPHATHGEEVCAVVVLAEGADVSERTLIQYSREHLAAYKYPRSVRLVTSLPKGPTGKILKRELRARLTLTTR